MGRARPRRRAELARAGRQRRALVVVNSFAQLIDLLCHSDHAAVLGRRVAHAHQDHLAWQPPPAPLALPRYRSMVCWPAHTEHDAGLRWLRDEVLAIASQGSEGTLRFVARNVGGAPTTGVEEIDFWVGGLAGLTWIAIRGSRRSRGSRSGLGIMRGSGLVLELALHPLDAEAVGVHVVLRGQEGGAGADVVQVDEANLPGSPDEWEWAATAMNRVLDAEGTPAGAEAPPLVVFGSYNERMYLAETGGDHVVERCDRGGGFPHGGGQGGGLHRGRVGESGLEHPAVGQGDQTGVSAAQGQRGHGCGQRTSNELHGTAPPV